jgi:hypothetical protein
VDWLVEANIINKHAVSFFRGSTNQSTLLLNPKEHHCKTTNYMVKEADMLQNDYKNAQLIRHISIISSFMLKLNIIYMDISPS